MITQGRPALASRRVRRLHVRAIRDDDAARAATLLSDALHTASLPGADEGRLVIIRRLALGRISPHASPASLALIVEQFTREAATNAVASDAPSAAGADAVVFADRSAALVALARRQSRHLAADEWFWNAVIPSWRRTAHGERWRALLETAHQGPEGAVVAAAVLGAAIDGGATDELFMSIERPHAIRWLRLAGWPDVRTDTCGTDAGRPEIDRIDIVERAARAWPPDERVVWLATLLAIRRNAARAADPHLAATIARALHARRCDTSTSEDLRTSAVPPATGPAPAEHGEPFTPNLPAGVAEPAIAERTELRNATLASGVFEPAAAEPRLESSVPLARETHPATQASIADEFSPCAGLPFVVPILGRVGFSEYLASHPGLLEARVPLRLLLFVGERAGLRPDDPLARALAVVDNERQDDESRLEAWVTIVRRWCRRRCRMGLAALIRRPGHVHVTGTHLDVFFDLARADIRLRRVALDVDPGWVPWLGRVVQFHYREPR